MTELSKEEGVIMALEERFEKQRLPRLLALKDGNERRAQKIGEPGFEFGEGLCPQ